MALTYKKIIKLLKKDSYKKFKFFLFSVFKNKFSLSNLSFDKIELLCWINLAQLIEATLRQLSLKALLSD